MPSHDATKILYDTCESIKFKLLDLDKCIERYKFLRHQSEESSKYSLFAYNIRVCPESSR